MYYLYSGFLPIKFQIQILYCIYIFNNFCDYRITINTFQMIYFKKWFGGIQAIVYNNQKNYCPFNMQVHPI